MNTLSKALASVCLVLVTILGAIAWNTHEASNGPFYYEWVGAGNKATSVAIEMPVSVSVSADGKTVFYAHTGRLFKSTDGGKSWKLLVHHLNPPPE
jgi:photosystem II stability/assembly factor-like uncharacterized protein